MSAQISENIDQRTDYNGSPGKLMRMMSYLLQVPLFVLVTGLLMVFGWQIRGEEYLTAESGFGYALGIAGGVLMLSQFLYPLRKKIKWMRNWGKVAIWFKAHMAVGVVAPVLILYHANFGLGSINSNVALAAMALVVGSGLVGRYIYTKINQTLYGRVATLEELKSASESARADLDHDMQMDSVTLKALRLHEAKMLKAGESWLALFPQLFLLGFRTRLMRWRLKRRFVRKLKMRALSEDIDKVSLRKQRRAGKRHIASYVLRVRKVAEYRIYRRIFSLWHVLHIPLFAMLVVSGIVHIVAVHIY